MDFRRLDNGQLYPTILDVLPERGLRILGEWTVTVKPANKSEVLEFWSNDRVGVAEYFWEHITLEITTKTVGDTNFNNLLESEGYELSRFQNLKPEMEFEGTLSERSGTVIYERPNETVLIHFYRPAGHKHLLIGALEPAQIFPPEHLIKVKNEDQKETTSITARLSRYLRMRTLRKQI